MPERSAPGDGWKYELLDGKVRAVGELTFEAAPDGEEREILR